MTVAAAPGTAIPRRARHAKGTVGTLVPRVSPQDPAFVERQGPRVDDVVAVPYQRQVCFVFAGHCLVVVDGGLADDDASTIFDDPRRHKHSGAFYADEALESRLSRVRDG